MGDNQTGCDDHNGSTGERLTLTGSISHPGTVDTETVTVDWGDASAPVTLSAGPGVISDYYDLPARSPTPTGALYLTTTPGFNGRVTTNATVNATYTTMTNIVDTAAASGGIDGNQVTPLKTKWTIVQNYLRAGNLKAARAALHDFATLVRSQSGKKIQKATADALIAYALYRLHQHRRHRHRLTRITPPNGGPAPHEPGRCFALTDSGHDSGGLSANGVSGPIAR